uniref:Uncharacterized protein LOC105117923 n=1 Tax=Rhizophora mucronata TaxID=61149 RepID=A0A2P2KWF9_RHIMU
MTFIGNFLFWVFILFSGFWFIHEKV